MSKKTAISDPPPKYNSINELLKNEQDRHLNERETKDIMACSRVPQIDEKQDYADHCHQRLARTQLYVLQGQKIADSR